MSVVWIGYCLEDPGWELDIHDGEEGANAVSDSEGSMVGGESISL